MPGEPFAVSSSAGPDLVSGLASAGTETLPEAPSAGIGMIRSDRPPLAVASHTQTFSTVALGVSVGTGGVELQAATPLNSRVNLRAGIGFFTYETSFTVDSIPIDGTLRLGSVHAGVDWFLFGNSFFLSPGFTFADRTNYNAKIFIAGNQIITVNDQDYTSDPDDPIRGTAAIQFGSRFAPRLTLGHGNMIPHRDKNWTFPFEFGFEYIKRPAAAFALTGSSCDSPGDCGPIQNDPSTQMNIDEQQREIVDDIAPLRFFPIIQFGVAYKFGH